MSVPNTRLVVCRDLSHSVRSEKESEYPLSSMDDMFLCNWSMISLAWNLSSPVLNQTLPGLGEERTCK
jgi:hypothetical protein